MVKSKGYFTFGTNFEKKFINETQNPDIALIELVSNAWDAGATEVKIEWPVIDGLVEGEIFSIKDNGHGMTNEEFVDFWTELAIDKRENIGHEIKLDNGVTRKILGRNGKGRLGLFGFSESYDVITCKNQQKSTFKVKKSKKKGQYAKVEEINVEICDEHTHGTYIECPIHHNYLEIEDIEIALSTRFGADPHFSVYINNNEINLLNLDIHEKTVIDFEGNTIEIVQIPRERYNKKLSQYQVAWWVGHRCAERETWRKLGLPLVGTNKIENKYLFCIVVNFLEEYVKSDWTGFEDNDQVQKVKKVVKEELLKITEKYVNESKHDRKFYAVKQSKKVFKDLNPISRREVGVYVDKILDECPTITNENLATITKILATMEVSKKGYKLLNQIANLKEGEIDKLTKILEKWSVNDAYFVLDELYERLRLIKQLEILVEDPKTLELKQLQPLFKKGLWIFGPEYEGTTNFTSNQTLNVVVRDLLKEDVDKFDLENSNKRPDFVVLEKDSVKSTLGIFSSKSYDDDNEDDEDDESDVDGYRKILILELKRGGSTIGYNEFNQANYYSLELENSGKVQGNPKIITYVLGAFVSPKLKKNSKIGDNIRIRPRTYEIVIERAKSRTFYFIDQLQKVKGITDLDDPVIKEALSEEENGSLDI